MVSVIHPLNNRCSVEPKTKPTRNENRNLMITISKQINKQFDLKYKETTLALGLTNFQNKRKINWNPTKNLLL